jgi:hypothetical protein
MEYLLFVILFVVYFGVGYISTLTLDTLEKKRKHNSSLEKITSVLGWPILMIVYFFVSLDDED